MADRSIWFGFIGSFAPKFYKQIAFQSFGRSFWYLTLLVLFISLIFSIKYTIIAREWIQEAGWWINTDFANELHDFLPEINIKDGEVSSPVEQPFIHNWKEFAFILDTTGKITSLVEYKNGILITKYKFIIRKTEDGKIETKEYDLSKISSLKIIPAEKEGEILGLIYKDRKFSLTDEVVDKWVGIIRRFILPIIAVSLLLYQLIAKLILLLLFSLVSLIVNKIVDAKLEYRHLLNIGVYALTPYVAMAVLFGLSNFKMPLLWLIHIGLYIAFIIFAILQSRTRSVG